ncbi:MAG: magnesium transporter [Clostridia bacterium]|nr:magnesium transporter [Clostridia bacterium]
MFETEIIETLSSLLAERKISEIKEFLREYNEVDIAEILAELKEEDAVKIFRIIPKEPAAEIFASMDSDLQESVISAITDRELHNILNELFVDDTVDLLEEMPANVVNRILKHTDSETRKAINQLLRYPEDSAGSLMNTEFIDLKKEMTVKGALVHIRRYGDSVEDISTFYVTEKDRVLTGTLSLKDIILASEDTLIGDIMDERIVFCHTGDDKEEVAAMFTKYGLLAMPVVDTENRIVGIITVDDAVTVIEEETTEDFEIMAAVTPSEDSYLKTGVFRHFINRIPWLMILMLSAAITGSIIDSFESKLSSLGFLIGFIPMLMNTGGNCGSQTSILVIRCLALGELKGFDVLKAWFKEIRISLLCGVSLGIVNFLRILVMKYYFGGGEFAFDLVINMALTVSISLLITVIFAKSIGCLLPIGAKKLGFDPAIMASPFITTIVDSLSLLIYFNVAQIIFNV